MEIKPLPSAHPQSEPSGLKDKPLISLNVVASTGDKSPVSELTVEIAGWCTIVASGGKYMISIGVDIQSFYVLLEMQLAQQLHLKVLSRVNGEELSVPSAFIVNRIPETRT